jgi:hypothetical protein
MTNQWVGWVLTIPQTSHLYSRMVVIVESPVNGSKIVNASPSIGPLLKIPRDDCRFNRRHASRTSALAWLCSQTLDGGMGSAMLLNKSSLKGHVRVESLDWFRVS